MNSREPPALSLRFGDQLRAPKQVHETHDVATATDYMARRR